MKIASPAVLAAAAGISLLAASLAAGSFDVFRPDLASASPAPCCVRDDPPAGVEVQHVLTLDGANRVIAAAVAKARERAAGGAIAVVDSGGNLIALQRLDATFPAGAAVSIGKARTAALFRKPTRAFEESINGGRVALAAVEGMTPLQGGVPILHDGFVVGAIGVSGAHSQAEDEEIALAGAAAIADARLTTAH